MEGAASGRKLALENDFEENDSLKYAALRNILLRKGKKVEILANYEPCLHYVSEWWKQLFGESEGKDQKGIFPASVDLTTDLHSMGQFIQDGSRIMFETVMNVETPKEELTINEEPVVDRLTPVLSHSRLVASLPLWRAALAAHATSTIALYDATLTARTSLPRKARREPICADENEAS